MLEIAVDYRGFDPDWLQRHVADPELGIRPDDSITLLRNIFEMKVEMRQPVAWADFVGFGFSSGELRLSAPIDRAYLGQELLGSLRLDERVASGGVAVAYRATSLADGSVMAVKIPRLAETRRNDDVYSHHIREEAAILGRLHADGVPRLIDIQDEDFGPVLVVEWIDTVGGPGLPETLLLTERLRLIADVGRTLDQIHQQDLIHGDVKQDNLLVDRQVRVWLTDFNITRDAPPEKNVDGPLPGTLAMMSQEALVGVASDAAISQDVYALGVLLFEVIEGKPFLKARSREEALVGGVLKGGVHGPEFSPETPELLQAICRAATTRHVHLRFASAADFAKTLDDYLAGNLLSDNVPPRRSRLSAWQFGERLGLCATRIRVLQERLSSAFECDPNSKIPPRVQEGLGYGIGAAIAADDLQGIAERLKWKVEACASGDVLMKAFYGGRRLKVADLDAVHDAANEFDQWFRNVWADIQNRVGPAEPELFLLLSTSLQLRFTARSPTARESWESIARNARLPENLISEFLASTSACQELDDWKVPIESLGYRVEKWLRWE